MKRSIYIAFIAAMTFSIAACTKQSTDPTLQVPDASRSYIFFEPEVVTSDNTKATVITGETLPSAVGTAFGIIGYHGTSSLFGAPTASNRGIAQVARSADGGFEYSPLVAWQGADNHDFYAFYPYNLNANVSHNVNNTANLANPYITYSQPTANDATMIDLLTAKASATKAAGNEVAIKFYHRLWALDVEITNSQTSGLNSSGSTVATPDLTITGIQLSVNGFPQVTYIPLDVDGNITYMENAVLPETTYTISYTASQATIPYGETEPYGALLFAPVPANTFQYKLVISFTDSRGEASSFTYPSSGYKTSSVAFEGGKRYSLVVNKTPDVFVVGSYADPDGDESNEFAPSDWAETDVDHTFN